MQVVKVLHISCKIFVDNAVIITNKKKPDALEPADVVFRHHPVCGAGGVGDEFQRSRYFDVCGGVFGRVMAG